MFMQPEIFSLKPHVFASKVQSQWQVKNGRNIIRCCTHKSYFLSKIVKEFEFAQLSSPEIHPTNGIEDGLTGPWYLLFNISDETAASEKFRYRFVQTMLRFVH